MIASTKKPKSARRCSRQVWETESIRSAKHSPASDWLPREILRVDHRRAQTTLSAVVGRLHPLDFGAGCFPGSFRELTSRG